MAGAGRGRSIRRLPTAAQSTVDRPKRKPGADPHDPSAASATAALETRDRARPGLRSAVTARRAYATLGAASSDGRPRDTRSRRASGYSGTSRRSSARLERTPRHTSTATRVANGRACTLRRAHETADLAEKEATAIGLSGEVAGWVRNVAGSLVHRPSESARATSAYSFCGSALETGPDFTNTRTESMRARGASSASHTWTVSRCSAPFQKPDELLWR